ncbi:MAG: hypothetical protein FJY88_05880 [Candidatus Eisenbacteria bacterium]|nr:hypothetical protein [Candidatus Eisenbacteria bacterium]
MPWMMRFHECRVRSNRSLPSPPAVRASGGRSSRRIVLCLILGSLLSLAAAGCFDRVTDLPRRHIPRCPPRDNGGLVVTPDPIGVLASDPYQVRAVSIQGRILSLSVSASGGCADHAWTLYVSEAFMESYPAQTRGFLVHEDNGDPCDAILQEDLAFDLAPLIAAYARQYGGAHDPIVIHIAGDDRGESAFTVRYTPRCR